MSLPKVVSQEEWRRAREELLAKEKELTRRRDALSAERRQLPMVEIEKDYVFEGPDGEAALVDLFDGRRQLFVGHFMFDPSWEDGCPSCSAGVDEVSKGLIEHLNIRDSSLAYVSRAPIEKLERYEQPIEMPGLSCFLRADDRVFHTYSTYARGAEMLGGSYYWLDLTALGRQEDWEEPKGRTDSARAAVPDFAA
jgi:predicted dithiol-disulfide oxidoreductase (DUF899 family)